MINSAVIPVLLLFAVAAIFLIDSLNKYLKAKNALSELDTLIAAKKKEITESYREEDERKKAAGPSYGTGSSGRPKRERTVSPETRSDAGGSSDGLVGTWSTLGGERGAKRTERTDPGGRSANYAAETAPKPDLEPVILFQCLPLTDYWQCPVCCAKNHIRKSRSVCEACGSMRIAG